MKAGISRDYINNVPSDGNPSNWGVTVTLDTGNQWLVEQWGGILHVWSKDDKGVITEFNVTELMDLRFLAQIINEAIMVHVGGERQ